MTYINNCQGTSSSGQIHSKTCTLQELIRGVQIYNLFQLSGDLLTISFQCHQATDECCNKGWGKEELTQTETTQNLKSQSLTHSQASIKKRYVDTIGAL